jgi:hypothetical protein
MVLIKINGKDYRVADSWADITISQAAALLTLSMPESLKSVYSAALNPGGLLGDMHTARIQEAEQAISVEDQYKNIPLYFSRVTETLSDIPVDVLRTVNVNSIKTLYHTYLKTFVEGMHFSPEATQFENIGKFTYNGTEYHLPTNKEIFGQKVPLVNISALEFAESSSLMISLVKMGEDKDFTQAANLISILCRPEGEPYNEDVCLQRAEQFKGLTMDICWSVFFSLITPLVILGQCAQISMLEGLIKEEKEAMNLKVSDGTGKSFS